MIGRRGNEGKPWFQRYLVNSYGSDRVFNCNIEKRADGIEHALSKQIVFLIEVFLFNIPRSFPEVFIPYTLLEDIKDGQTVSCKYNSRCLCLNTPNILIVFANNPPEYAKMSKDRWKIFTIIGEKLSECNPVY